jgi:RND family efflux transporter MFP subunit
VNSPPTISEHSALPDQERSASSVVPSATRKSRTIIIVFILLLLAAAVAGLTAMTRKTATSNSVKSTHQIVAVVPVTPRDLQDEIRFSGEFRSYQEIDLYAQVPGYVKDIVVDIGDQVEKNQVLATLEIPELADQIHQAEASFRRAVGELKRSQAEYTGSHLELQRLKGVISENATLLPQQEIDTAVAKDSAEEAAVEAATSQRDIAQAELDRLHTMVSLCRIVAPFSGVVSKRYADAGSFIRGGISPSAPAMPLIRLSQNNLVRLIFPIPEVLSAKAAVADPIEVSIAALQRHLIATITRFTHTIDATTRTMEIEADIPNQDLSIIPGMFAIVSLSTQRRSHVLAVPINAVLQNNAETTVMVVDSAHHGAIRVVTLGLETPNFVEVTSGLADGELVVVGSRPTIDAHEELDPHTLSTALNTSP